MERDVVRERKISICHISMINGEKILWITFYVSNAWLWISVNGWICIDVCMCSIHEMGC